MEGEAKPMAQTRRCEPHLPTEHRSRWLVAHASRRTKVRAARATFCAGRVVALRRSGVTECATSFRRGRRALFLAAAVCELVATAWQSAAASLLVVKLRDSASAGDSDSPLVERSGWLAG